jgi:hypothetical protein
MAAVLGRVVLPQKISRSQKPTINMFKYRGEFINLVTRNGSVALHPVTSRELVMNMAGKQLKRLTNFLEQGVASIRGKAFLKAEAYQDEKDPRIISDMPEDNREESGTFAGPMGEFLKTMPWYAFGKTPSEIAHRVATICSEATEVTTTDFSRFDGHFTNFLVDFIIELWSALFPDFKMRVRELVRKTFDTPMIFGSSGYAYDPGMSIRSGWWWTSHAGSVTNAFVNYACLRHKGMTPREAYESLGIYGGDDGLTAGITAEEFNATALRFSLSAKAESFHREHSPLGVNFLARFYGPDVWFGDPSSICDVPRQMSKFHATPKLPSNVTWKDKLHEKTLAALLSDAQTPVFGDFLNHSKAFLEKERSFDSPEVVRKELRPYVFTVDTESQYPQHSVFQWGFMYLEEWKITGPEKWGLVSNCHPAVKG